MTTQKFVKSGNYRIPRRKQSPAPSTDANSHRPASRDTIASSARRPRAAKLSREAPIVAVPAICRVNVVDPIHALAVSGKSPAMAVAVESRVVAEHNSRADTRSQCNRPDPDSKSEEPGTQVTTHHSLCSLRRAVRAHQAGADVPRQEQRMIAVAPIMGRGSNRRTLLARAFGILLASALVATVAVSSMSQASGGIKDLSCHNRTDALH